MEKQNVAKPNAKDSPKTYNARQAADCIGIDYADWNKALAKGIVPGAKRNGPRTHWRILVTVVLALKALKERKPHLDTAVALLGELAHVEASAMPPRVVIITPAPTPEDLEEIEAQAEGTVEEGQHIEITDVPLDDWHVNASQAAAIAGVPRRQIRQAISDGLLAGAHQTATNGSWHIPLGSVHGYRDGLVSGQPTGDLDEPIFNGAITVVSVECIDPSEVVARPPMPQEGQLFAHGTKQGRKRTNAEKRRAITIMLKDPAWTHWSDRSIAYYCQVNHKTVAAVRKELGGEPSSERTYNTKHGTTSTMNTEAIGNSQGHCEEDARVINDINDALSSTPPIMPVMMGPRFASTEPEQVVAPPLVNRAGSSKNETLRGTVNISGIRIQDIRVRMIDGKPWFCLVDARNGLGFSRATEVSKWADWLSDEDKVLLSEQDLRGCEQETWFASPKGLFKILGRVWARAKDGRAEQLVDWAMQKAEDALLGNIPTVPAQVTTDPGHALILGLLDRMDRRADMAAQNAREFMLAVLERVTQRVEHVEGNDHAQDVRIDEHDVQLDAHEEALTDQEKLITEHASLLAPRRLLEEARLMTPQMQRRTAVRIVRNGINNRYAAWMQTHRGIDLYDKFGSSDAMIEDSKNAVRGARRQYSILSARAWSQMEDALEEKEKFPCNRKYRGKHVTLPEYCVKMKKTWELLVHACQEFTVPDGLDEPQTES